MMNHDDEVMDFFVDDCCSFFQLPDFVVLTFFDSILILCFHLDNKIITFMVSIPFSCFSKDVVVRS